MSGQSAIRGFTYQTIISVIKSLSDPSWKYVNVEPDTTNDKVDILWEDEHGNITCQQVKSSINNFSKGDISEWINLMKKDVPGAISYQLLLVGNQSKGTENYIKGLTQNSTIKIEVIVFNLEYLESKVRDELHRFLSAKNYQLPHETIELIASGLIYQFFYFSVLSQKVSREEFAEYILKWARFNYSKAMNANEKKAVFRLLFYDEIKHTFHSDISPFHLNITAHDFIAALKKNIYEQYEKGLTIELPAAKEMKPVRTKEELLYLINFMETSKQVKSDIPGYQKELITGGMKKYFDIIVEDEYFHLGELMEDQFSIFSLYQGKKYYGTEDEKNKKKIIDSIYWDLQTLQETNKTIEFANSKFCLALILENTGSNFDEEIVVDLSFPEEVKITTADTFYVTDDTDTLQQLIKSRVIKYALEINGDSFVTNYKFPEFTDLDADGTLNMMYELHNTSKRQELMQDKFRHQLDHVFNFEMFNDQPGIMQLRFHFKQLNPNMKMAFPCYILFEADKEFEIKYEIKTKNSSDVHSGVLICNLND